MAHPQHGKVATVGRTCASWICTTQAKGVFGIIIVLNAVVIGVDVEMYLRWGETFVAVLVIYIIRCLITIAFIIELALRVHGYGFRAAVFTWAGVLDVFIISVSIVDLGPMVGLAYVKQLSRPRLLELLCLVNVMKLSQLSEQSLALSRALSSSVTGAFIIFAMLFVVMLCGSLLCANELGHSADPVLHQAFGSIGASLYSHFKLTTLDNWISVSAAAMEVNTAWIIYFLLYIFLSTVTLGHLLTGFIMNGVLQDSTAKSGSSYELKVLECQAFVDEVTRRLDVTKDSGDEKQTIDAERFAKLLQDPYLQQVFSIYDISLRLAPAEIFDILDEEGKQRLSAEEVATRLFELRGSRAPDSIHPVLLRADLRRQEREVISRMRENFADLVSNYQSELDLLAEAVVQCLLRIERDAVQAAEVYAARRQGFLINMPDSRHHSSAREAGVFAVASGPSELPEVVTDEEMLADKGECEIASVSSEDPMPREEFLAATHQALATFFQQRELKRAGCAEECDARLAERIREAAMRGRDLEDAVLEVERELRAAIALETAYLQRTAGARQHQESPEADLGVVDIRFESSTDDEAPRLEISSKLRSRGLDLNASQKSAQKLHREDAGRGLKLSPHSRSQPATPLRRRQVQALNLRRTTVKRNGRFEMLHRLKSIDVASSRVGISGNP